MRVEIVNWAKYQPRHDIKSTSWFRLENTFWLDPLLTPLDSDAKLVWIVLLSLASQRQSAVFEVDLMFVRRAIGVRMKKLISTLEYFQDHEKIKITPPLTLRGRNAHVALRTDETDETDGRTVAGPARRALAGPVGPAALLITPVPRKKKPQTDGSQVWAAYAAAYEMAYGQVPPRNAKQNAICSSLVQRLGADDACRVVGFYLTHRRAYYVQKVHQLECCLADCEGLRTQMLGGHRITSADAKMVDDSQTNEQTFAQVAANLRKKGWDV